MIRRTIVLATLLVLAVGGCREERSVSGTPNDIGDVPISETLVAWTDLIVWAETGHRDHFLVVSESSEEFRYHAASFLARLADAVRMRSGAACDAIGFEIDLAADWPTPITTVSDAECPIGGDVERWLTDEVVLNAAAHTFGRLGSVGAGMVAARSEVGSYNADGLGRVRRNYWDVEVFNDPGRRRRVTLVLRWRQSVEGESAEETLPTRP
ncbi:MAG: hypothetical protein AAGI53_07460 [Planctomycetota bacterium]